MGLAATTRHEPTILHCTDVDAANRHGADVYHPHQLELLDESASFDMRLRAVTFGPVTVGVLSYGTPVMIQTGDMETAYEVNVPLVADMECRAGHQDVVATPERAVVFRPHGRTQMLVSGEHAPLLGVKLDRSALETRLGELTGRPVAGEIATSSFVDLTSGRGREWWSVTRSMVDLFDSHHDQSGLLGNELVMRPLTQSVLNGLLFAVDHPHLPDLLEPADPTTPATLRRAQEFINDHAADPLSVADIARGAGVSVRGLQASFQQHLQQRPMDYVREVRTRRTHDDLLVADPARTTVADVAHRWGFVHVGRFASRYREMYGVAPSETLRARA